MLHNIPISNNELKQLLTIIVSTHKIKGKKNDNMYYLILNGGFLS